MFEFQTDTLLLVAEMKLAIVSGTSINYSEVFSDWEELVVDTEFGKVSLRSKGELLAMNRHGFENPMPPHSINYRANVAALDQLAVRSVVTVSSVGSLDIGLPPGSLVSLEDYMSFAPMTFIDNRMSVFAPELTNPLLEEIAAISPSELVRGKVYAQTRGPRFETRAEVRALRSLGADVVGMTFANEADLMLERGFELTALCMVDNYAHGVGAESLSGEGFSRLVENNQKTVDLLLTALVLSFQSA